MHPEKDCAAPDMCTESHVGEELPRENMKLPEFIYSECVKKSAEGFEAMIDYAYISGFAKGLTQGRAEAIAKVKAWAEENMCKPRCECYDCSTENELLDYLEGLK